MNEFTENHWQKQFYFETEQSHKITHNSISTGDFLVDCTEILRNCFISINKTSYLSYNPLNNIEFFTQQLINIFF